MTTGDLFYNMNHTYKMIAQAQRSSRTLVAHLRRNYDTLSPEDYLFNQRDSMMVTKRQRTELEPLPNSNHSEGTTDRVALVGIPLLQDEP